MVAFAAKVGKVTPTFGLASSIVVPLSVKLFSTNVVSWGSYLKI